MKTYMKTKQDLDKRKWYLFDAENRVLGRLATSVADTLRGKRKVDYTPNVDSGDFVVIVNASKVKLTGSKMQKKVYYKHSGYVGGLKKSTAETLLEKHPEEVIKRAVKGMLPKTRLGKRLIRKLKVYPGIEHPHTAQDPETVKLSN